MLSTYHLSPEQIEIRTLARDFARREISPFIGPYENEDISKSELPKKISQSGLINGRITPDLGGLGLSLLDTVLIAQELAGACSGIAALVEASELAITAVLVCGTKAQKEAYLPRLAKEDKLAGIALPYDGSGVTNNNLIVEQESSAIVINGFCPLVLNANIADWFAVYCSGGCFLVPRNADGLTLSEKIPFMGRKAADARRVDFNNVRLDPICRINVSAADRGNILTQNAALISSGCVGLAQSALEQATNYARQRKTFGVPIASHQAIAFMLADMKTDIEASRLLVFQLVDAPLEETYSLGQCALSFALDMIARVTIDSVQILGGYGYTKDYPVEKFMRDARTYQSFYGPTYLLKEQLGQAILAQGK
jgi:acyl-CoA dehydrogenase